MNKNFPYYLSKFLKNYLVVERNMSDRTIKSYKDGMQLFITYLVQEENIKLIDITFENITREIVANYLNYLENDRKNSINTRNQRLAIIKSFYQFCLTEEIENIDNIERVLKISSKKYPRKIIEFLTEEEIESLLKSIDTTSKKNRRNLLVIALLYDTAARASEIIHLKIEKINLENSYIILSGKGNKQRIVPIMKNTKTLLINFMKENKINSGYLFQNKNKNHQNENFIKDIVKVITKDVNFSKEITPHTFRHSRAIHLLSAGVNLLYIRDLLGHESVVTTERYARVIEKAKFEAIRKATSSQFEDNLPDWNNDVDLLSQLLEL